MAQYIADTNFFPRPATRPHTGAHVLARSHAASAGRRFIRQGHAAFLGADLHPLVMFRADLLALLLGLGSAHAVAILIALLLGHHLRTVDLVLVADLILCLQPILGLVRGEGD